MCPRGHALKEQHVILQKLEYELGSELARCGFQEKHLSGQDTLVLGDNEEADSP